MAVFINHTAIYNQSSLYCNTAHINILKASKHLIKLLSAYSNNNSTSLHKLENKFCMRVGDQKLRYDLEWPYACMRQGAHDAGSFKVATVHFVGLFNLRKRPGNHFMIDPFRCWLCGPLFSSSETCFKHLHGYTMQPYTVAMSHSYHG